MQNKKLAAAQKRYAQAQAQSALLLQAIAQGGSYALWRKAVEEETVALQRLQALQADKV